MVRGTFALPASAEEEEVTLPSTEPPRAGDRQLAGQDAFLSRGDLPPVPARGNLPPDWQGRSARGQPGQRQGHPEEQVLGTAKGQPGQRQGHPEVQVWRASPALVPLSCLTLFTTVKFLRTKTFGYANFGGFL